VSEERLEFVIRAGSGKEDLKELCREFEISRPTGYKWLERYRECDRLEELSEKSRRPLRSPTKTTAEKEAAVVALRQRYPDWGAKKLRVLLQREGVEIPRITIHRILLRNQLVRERDRRRRAVKRYERELANQLWQMDFKGMPEARKGCVPLSIIDDHWFAASQHSRYLVGLFSLGGTKAEEVKDSLETVFEASGMPEAMLMDHGTPWWTMKSESGWTWLTVWLMKQGVRIYMSGYRHPQTQGKVERCLDQRRRRMGLLSGDKATCAASLQGQEHGSGDEQAAEGGEPELAGLV
jgi:transposase InsO family protein